LHFDGDVKPLKGDVCFFAVTAILKMSGNKHRVINYYKEDSDLKTYVKLVHNRNTVLPARSEIGNRTTA